MQYKKNKFLIFFIVNFFLILIIALVVFLSLNYFNKVNIGDNENVKGQIIINPEAEPSVVLDRTIKIQLASKVDESLNWEFKPVKEFIEVKIGENNIVEYYGKNISNETITSTADFKIEPEAVQAYLIKSECFCFQEQTLKSGESKIFTMVFYIDSSLDSDWYFDNLKELVFTYEFSEYKSL